MHKIARIIALVLGLVWALLILAFVLENQQSISLVFLGWPLPEVPVSITIISAFLVGMLIGPVLTFLYRRIKGKVRRTSV